MLKNLGALALAGVMIFSSTGIAVAGTNQGALAPGKPADVKKAQTFVDQDYLMWLLGAGVVIGGIVLVTSGSSHGPIGATTTCSPDGTCTSTTTTTSATTTSTTTTTTH